MQTMNGQIAVTAGAVLLVVTAACGDERPEDTSGNDPYRNAVSDKWLRMSLDCPNKLRTSGIVDAWPPEGYSRPTSVAKPFADQAAGESVVVTKNRRGPHAWILRPDETARAVLDMRHEAEYGGWYLTSFKTCGDAPLPAPTLD
jgi:hypothetical protein